MRGSHAGRARRPLEIAADEQSGQLDTLLSQTLGASHLTVDDTESMFDPSAHAPQRLDGRDDLTTGRHHIFDDQQPSIGDLDALGKALGTANGWLVAAVLPAALMLRRREHDPRVVRLLFTASSALVVVIALMFTLLLWAELDSERFGRIFGALVVLEVLLVALQPILARAHPDVRVHRLRVRVATGATIDLRIEAPDLSAAASKAIRTVEREGHHVVGLDVGAL